MKLDDEIVALVLFTYITDTLYNGSTATTSAQLRFYETGGALFTG